MIVTVETPAPKREGQVAKGRSFSAEVVGFVSCDKLLKVSSPTGKVQRPLWITFAAPPQQLKAFCANLILGRKAIRDGTYHSTYTDTSGFELVKRQKYKYFTQSSDDKGIVYQTFWTPAPFKMDPGFVDPDEISFVMMPPKSWYQKQTCTMEESQALLFTAYLDRRSRYPIPTGASFALLLYRKFHDLRYLYVGSEYDYRNPRLCYRTDKMGYPDPVFVSCTHEQLSDVLKALIKDWSFS